MGRRERRRRRRRWLILFAEREMEGGVVDGADGWRRAARGAGTRISMNDLNECFHGKNTIQLYG
jgi:hypothetical protein